MSSLKCGQLRGEQREWCTRGEGGGGGGGLMLGTKSIVQEVGSV